MPIDGIHGASSAVIDRDIREVIDTNLPWDKFAGKTVLVTGASGMIPAYAVYTLLALNDLLGLGLTVLGLVRDPDRARKALAVAHGRNDFVLIKGDVRDPLRLDRSVDLVIHGASPARPALHAGSPVDTIRANVQGAFNLLDLCVASGNAHIVLMSSAEVYGQQADDGTLVSEDSYGAVDILNPRSCYTEGKRAAETIAISYRAQFGVPVTIARFGHIYGPGMALDDGRV
jgi:UDP-glucuronate decarboxylase